MATQEMKTKEERKARQIIIETDGQKIWFKKLDVTPIELIAICNMIVEHATKPKDQ